MVAFSRAVVTVSGWLVLRTLARIFTGAHCENDRAGGGIVWSIDANNTFALRNRSLCLPAQFHSHNKADIISIAYGLHQVSTIFKFEKE
jgi:hypothetical protein